MKVSVEPESFIEKRDFSNQNNGEQQIVKFNINSVTGKYAVILLLLK